MERMVRFSNDLLFRWQKNRKEHIEIHSEAGAVPASLGACFALRNLQLANSLSLIRQANLQSLPESQIGLIKLER